MNKKTHIFHVDITEGDSKVLCGGVSWKAMRSQPSKLFYIRKTSKNGYSKRSLSLANLDPKICKKCQTSLNKLSSDN